MLGFFLSHPKHILQLYIGSFLLYNVSSMNLKRWNQEQIAEALGDVNRYFFWLKNRREPNDDNELLLYYIENGGALHKRKAMNEKEKLSETDQTS